MLANIRIGQRIAISIVLLLIVTVTILTALFFSRFESLLADARAGFERVQSRKPAASRPRSREVYLVATGAIEKRRRRPDI